MESQFCIYVKTLKTLLKRKIDRPQVIGRLAVFFFQERVMIIHEHHMVNVKYRRAWKAMFLTLENFLSCSLIS